MGYNILHKYLPSGFNITVDKYCIEYDCTTDSGYIISIFNSGTIYMWLKDDDSLRPCEKSYEIIKYLESINYDFNNSPIFTEMKINNVLKNI